MHAFIGISPCLQCIRARPSVSNCEARLITEDTVPPVPRVSPSVRSSSHMAASPVIQSQSGTPGGMPRLVASSQKPVYQFLRFTTSSEIGGSSPRTNEQLGWNDCLWPFGSTVCLLGLMWLTNISVASQNFAAESLQCNILATSCWE